MAATVPQIPGRARSLSWQERLQDHCRLNQITPPVFNIVSDRRGGRTAWSCAIVVQSTSQPSSQQTVQARYWYDGNYLNQAKEDAAEVALKAITAAAGVGGPGSGLSSPTGSTASSGWYSTPGRDQVSPPGTAYGYGSSSVGGGTASTGAGGSGAGPNTAGGMWPRSPPPTGRW